MMMRNHIIKFRVSTLPFRLSSPPLQASATNTPMQLRKLKKTFSTDSSDSKFAFELVVTDKHILPYNKKLRLDFFLREAELSISRSLLKNGIKQGRVYVNGKQQTKGAYIVKLGDLVQGDFPLPKPLKAIPQNIPLDILYEDEYLMVVNKAKGMVVHPSPGHMEGTLVNALLYHCGLPEVIVGTPAATRLSLENQSHEDQEFQKQNEVAQQLYQQDDSQKQQLRQAVNGDIQQQQFMNQNQQNRQLTFIQETRQRGSDNFIGSQNNSREDSSQIYESQLFEKMSDEQQQLKELVQQMEQVKQQQTIEEDEDAEDNDDDDDDISQRFKLIFENNINTVIRPGIVHRLDKGTTGLIVVAKNEETHIHLSNQFKEKTTQRIYVSLTVGVPQPSKHTIQTNIWRDNTNRLKNTTFPYGGSIGKTAVSKYSVIGKTGNDRVGIVEWQLQTGRTHQIRVHAKHIGHPLFADDMYGGGRGTSLSYVGRGNSEKENKIIRALQLLNRPALHAKTLGFVHPQSGKEMVFTSDLPDDFKEVLELLELIKDE